MMAKARILCVDDEAQNVALIDAILAPLGSRSRAPRTAIKPSRKWPLWRSIWSCST